jgi:Glycosyltransferases involved in cell wall biogenesis
MTLVSIACISYNQEKYIRNTIEGFLIQQTTFPFEIIIHDDASTDKTAQIIREYEQKYPNLIFPIIQIENQFSKGIKRILATFVFPKCRGKYIALCEGDDYWTDPNKLQKQVDFLESNPDYGLVHTGYTIFSQNKKAFFNPPGKTPPSGKVFLNLLERNFISTLTVMAHTQLLLEASKKLKRDQKFFIMGDYPLWLHIARKRKIGYINDITAVYRFLENSASHSKNVQSLINFEKSVMDVVKYFALINSSQQTEFIVRKRVSEIQNWIFHRLLKNPSLWKDNFDILSGFKPYKIWDKFAWKILQRNKSYKIVILFFCFIKYLRDWGKE